LTSFNFFSFNEKRDLEQRISQLEEALKREKKHSAEDRERLERRLLEADVIFQERLNKEKKTAFEQGTASGKAEGIKAGEQSVFVAAEYLKQCGNKLLEYKNTFLKEAEISALRLSVAVASKIVEKEISENSDLIQTSLSKALKLINDKTGIVFRISEADFSVVKDKLPQLKSAFDDLAHIKIQIDERVSKGGAIIETNSGDIDARIEVQLDEILVQLLDNVE